MIERVNRKSSEPFLSVRNYSHQDSRHSNKELESATSFPRSSRTPNISQTDRQTDGRTHKISSDSLLAGRVRDNIWAMSTILKLANNSHFIQCSFVAHFDIFASTHKKYLRDLHILPGENRVVIRSSFIALSLQIFTIKCQSDS